MTEIIRHPVTITLSLSGAEMLALAEAAEFGSHQEGYHGVAEDLATLLRAKEFDLRGADHATVTPTINTEDGAVTLEPVA